MGDGGSGNDPEHHAQNPDQLLGKMLRIDVNVPDSDPIGYRIPPDNPFVGHGRRARRDLGLRPAQPVAVQLRRRRRAAERARWSSATSARAACEEIDYEPPGRGGRNYGWRNREGAIATPTPDTGRSAVSAPLTESDLRVRTQRRRLGHGWLRLSRHALGAAFAAATSSPTSLGRVWSLALTIDGAGEARASDRREHTAELGGADSARQHQLVRRRRRRRALRRQSLHRQDRSHHRAARGSLRHRRD